jgi:hypothetical protein
MSDPETYSSSECDPENERLTLTMRCSTKYVDGQESPRPRPTVRSHSRRASPFGHSDNQSRNTILACHLLLRIFLGNFVVADLMQQRTSTPVRHGGVRAGKPGIAVLTCRSIHHCLIRIEIILSFMVPRSGCCAIQIIGDVMDSRCVTSHCCVLRVQSRTRERTEARM